MIRNSKPSAKIAVSTPDPWTALEENLYLAIACIQLLNTFACEEAEARFGGEAAALTAGLTLFSDETIRRLHRSLEGCQRGETGR